MRSSSPKVLVFGLLALSASFSHGFAGDSKVTVGTHKNLKRLDIVEIKETFKRSDYALIRVVAFDLSPIEIPEPKDNTHGVVLEAKAKFHERFLAKVQQELAPAKVEAEAAAAPAPATAPAPAPAAPAPAAPAPAAAEATPTQPIPAPPAAPRVLLVKGVVTKLNPGSAAGRAFFGMFGGGQARIEITCELVDAASGKVLASLVHARAGAMSGGFGYDRLIQNLNEEIGEDVATLIKLFN